MLIKQQNHCLKLLWHSVSINQMQHADIDEMTLIEDQPHCSTAQYETCLGDTTDNQVDKHYKR